MVEAIQRKAKPARTETAKPSGAVSASAGKAGLAIPEAERESLLSLLRVAAWTYDPVNNTVTWQRIFAETVGETRPQTTERLADVIARYKEEDRAALLRHYEAALRDGSHGPVRFTVMNRAGIATHIESAAIRTGTKSGSPMVQGVFRNCEDDVGREVALQDALTLLTRLTSISPSAIMLLDGTGLIRSANPEFLRVFGISDERMLVARHIRASSNVLGKAFVSAISALLDNNKDVVKAQQRFQLANNTFIDMNFRCQRFGVDDSGYGLLFAGEVTDPDAVDMGLVFDKLPTPAMTISTPENLIVAANAAALRTFGLRREHVGNDTITQILMRSDDLNQIQSDITIEGGEEGLTCPVRNLQGGAANYQIKATRFAEDGRGFLVLEFHPAKAAGNGKAKPPARNKGKSKGLLSRVVDHLDF
ncbi:PAS domain-containing protein [Breoghania sp.]|uniref:PAS domain-containing protein n=1 Tax=Breoghania sp. TaxID=2065378 RepID=UPI002AAB05A5|nr:PAS domain-containing protein [Breoghania sp.]